MRLTIDYAAVTVRAEKQIRAIMSNADLANDDRIAADMASWANGVFLLWTELTALVSDESHRHELQIDAERLRRLMRRESSVRLPFNSQPYNWNGIHT